MNSDSVRELKALMTSTMVQAATAAGASAFVAKRGLAVAAQPRTAIEVVQRTMAIGIVKKGRSTFHVAVRLQRHQMEDSPQLAMLCRKAKREIDIRYVGRIVKRSIPWYQRSCRPLRIGASIGHHRITAGTLGCFVEDRGPSQTPMILSNNHVLANENAAKRGDAILQPGDLDGGVRPTDVVATLERFVKLRTRGANLVDAAVCKIRSGVEFRPANIRGLGKLAGLGPEFLDEGTIVHKLGRTTGLTSGRVTAFELDNVVVNYDCGNVRFDNQIEIEGSGRKSFCDGGDSGSLIVDDDRMAVALLFAGGDTGGSNGAGLTYANPIGSVLDALKIDLLS